MEFTIDQALQKAVAAHKSGQIQEADRFYTAILKAEPKHPDANHNLGVLAVSVGKVETALPFFKTALEANPKIAQFWLSYIDALIKLDRLADAKTVFDQAKSNGAKGNGFDQLALRLNEISKKPLTAEETSPEPRKDKPNILESLKLDQAIKLAKKKAKDSSPQEAKRIYQDILTKYPNNKRARDGLKGLAVGTDRKVSKYQDLPQNQIQSLTNLYHQGQLEQAINQANKLIKYFPNSATLFNIQGAILKGLGQLDLSVDAYKKALAIKPAFAEAYNNLGVSIQEQGKLGEAIEAFNKALAIKPDYAEAYNNTGAAFKEQGKLEEAIEAYNKALVIKSDYADAHNNMGNALNERGKFEEAIEAFNKALAKKPDFAEAHNNMGNALKEQDKLEEAIEAYNKALAIKPDFAETYNNIGNALREQDKLEEAIEAYNKALAKKPDYADAHNNIGNILNERGKLGEAIESFNKALAIKPDHAAAHRHLSTLTKYKSDTAQISTVVALLKRTDLKNSDRCHLLYTHAKMQEDLGDLKSAFESYVTGGDLRKKLLKYQFPQDQRLFARIKQSAPKFKDIVLKSTEEAIEHTPIFILGMPRSGTTLVEQIISSHSKVSAAGELKYVSLFGGQLASGLTATVLEALALFRQRYLAELAKRAAGQAFVTDKMPHNFLHIALICSAFPEAKIVHVRRDTKATCWSNFKHYFSSKGLGYSYNLDDTVKYHGLYKNLMHFWFQSYDDRIYNLDYDKLTEDQGSETRRLIEYLELNWEDACLAPQENRRSVETSSNQQVRRKVYTGSSQAWRKYEPFLHSIFEKLED
jgi:tetratricopeptide (TPR) repeat protein